jgi:CBS domain-containing protein
MKLVRDAMTREPRWCFDDEPAHKAIARMRAGGLSCMPVVDRTLRLVGMLTLDELAEVEETACWVNPKSID